MRLYCYVAGVSVNVLCAVGNHDDIMEVEVEVWVSLPLGHGHGLGMSMGIDMGIGMDITSNT